MIEPSRTYALVVGIETYKEPEAEDLDGPTYDACRFVDWLRSRGVPKENIHLFLSPLEKNLSALSKLELTYQNATFAAIHTYLTHDLTQHEGELFWLFWVGHGVMTRDQRRLLYADTAKQGGFNLNLDEFLLFAGSENIKQLPLQIYLIDACAPRLPPYNLPDLGFSAGDPKEEVDQSILLATSPGQFARNLTSEQTALFSREVLKALQAPPFNLWPPEMEELATHVKNQVEQASDSEQVPYFIKYKDRNGEELIFKRRTVTQVREDSAGTVPFPRVSLSDALAKLATLSLDKLSDVGTLPPGSRMTLRRNDYFVGREEALTELAKIFKGETSTRPRVIITGMGGAGKTQLASEFVYRYGQFFLGGVFWLNFAEEAKIQSEVIACGGPGALELYADRDGFSPEEKEQKVRKAWQSEIPCLLIFDNCEDEAKLAKWVPTEGGSRVLVTSRKGNWSATLGFTVTPLPESLPPEESVTLLRKYRDDLTQEMALNLADKLGGLPLALHLAGSYLKRYQGVDDLGDPSYYLKHLEHPDVIKHFSFQQRSEEASPTDYVHPSLEATFTVSYEGLSLKRAGEEYGVNATASTLLAYAACLAPGQGIPRTLLLSPLKERTSDGTATQVQDEETKVRDAEALMRLVDLGLLQVETAKMLKIHRLVARFVEAREQGAFITTREAVELALIAEAKQLNEAGDLATFRLWEVHLRHVTDGAIAREAREAVELCKQLAYLLVDQDNFEDAMGYWKWVEKLQPTADPVLNLTILGHTLYNQGAFDAAHTTIEQALDHIAKTEPLPTDARLADMLHDLGKVEFSTRDRARGRAYVESALSLREKVLGDTHLKVAESRSALGAILREEGHSEQAYRLLEAALTVQEKEIPNADTMVYTVNEPLYQELLEKAHTLNELGTLLLHQGVREKASAYYQRALTIREKLLGSDHPLTQEIRSHLSRLE